MPSSRVPEGRKSKALLRITTSHAFRSAFAFRIDHVASRDTASRGAPRGSQIAHVDARLAATRSAPASRRHTASSSSKLSPFRSTPRPESGR